MRDKAFNTHSSPKQFALQCFKTQQMFDKPVDYSLAALKFVPDWFVPTKMIRILSAAFYTVDNILYFNEDSANVVFPCNGMGIRNIDLNNINLDDTNYDEDDPDTVNIIRLLACNIKFQTRKALKKRISEDLIPIEWHPKRWWNFCMSEYDQKKKNRTDFY